MINYIFKFNFASILHICCYIKIESRYIKVLAVLDTGSCTTNVDLDFAKRIHLTLGKVFKRRVLLIDRAVILTTHNTQIILASQDKEFETQIKCTTVENFAQGCRLHDWSQEASKHKHLATLPIPKYPDPPEGVLLIGVDNADLFIPLEVKRAGQNQPIAIKTKLGWAIMGFESQDEKVWKTTDFLHEMVARNFELENFGLIDKEGTFSNHFVGGPKPPESWTPLEQIADDKMSVVKVGQNRYSVSMPWKDGYQLRLKNNLHLVKMRQDRSHSPQCMAKKGITKDAVDQILEEYLNKGYIEPVPKREEGQGWFLPFFEVVTPGKSTPIRIVFDCKAKYFGTSLNEQQMSTPNRLNDIVLCLIQFRHFKYALTGDITEMFLQVLLEERDRNKQWQAVPIYTHVVWVKLFS